MSSPRRRSIDLSKTNTSASMPIAMKAAFMPTTPPPMIITVAAGDAGHAAEQDAAAAEGLLEHEGARLRGELAGDLAHRREQRQPALRVLDGLVGDADRARRAQRQRQVAVGREVQVGEQDLSRAQQLDLRRLRLLHLQHHLRLGEHRLGVRHDARALRQRRRRRRARCPSRRRTAPAPRGRARPARARPPGSARRGTRRA